MFLDFGNPEVEVLLLKLLKQVELIFVDDKKLILERLDEKFPGKFKKDLEETENEILYIRVT